jgi:hypothetical protein
MPPQKLIMPFLSMVDKPLLVNEFRVPHLPPSIWGTMTSSSTQSIAYSRLTPCIELFLLLM